MGSLQDVFGSDFERQSWRDNYNGGRAAGDWTGNVNRELDRQREAFQGTTWSGSSSQPSALELARSRGRGGSGAGSSSVTTNGGDGGAGAGAPIVTTPQGTGGTGPGSAGMQVRQGGGAGAGSGLTISGPLMPKMNQNVTELMVGGDWWKSNPWFSDAEEWTTRYGEGEIAETLFLALNVTADSVFNTWRGASSARAALLSANGASPADRREPDPQWNDGWVSYDDGASWEFGRQGDPYLWDSGGIDPVFNRLR